MDYKTQLNELIDILVKEDASDLHLSEGYRPTIRVSGELIPLVKKETLSKEDTSGFIEALLSPDKKEVFFSEREIDFSYSHDENTRFRGNGFFSKGAVTIALRRITQRIRTLEELNLPDTLKTFARKQQGFFLVVGPVGHGKSTTLAAMLQMINQERAERIITIEDPLEYIYTPEKSVIDQREVGVDTADFRTALRSLFREDIDVVMIGEMRGPETISTAVTAAETGHLVFSTLHTNNASQTIDRIIDSFPSSQQDQIRVQLAGSLLGIFSQRLVPRVSGGRVPAYELLVNNNAVANLIRENRTHEIPTVIETGLEHGMVGLNRSLAELVRRGEISIENARMYSLNPALLDKLI